MSNPSPDDSAARKLAELEDLCRGHTDRGEERRILDIFASSTPGELSYLLSHMSFGELLSDVDDRPFGPDNRAALLDLLCVTRLPELSVAARAALLDALQRGRTGAGEEQAVERLFLGTTGAGLTALKNAVEGGEDYRDLHQLLYRDIDDGARRERILEHLSAHAVPSGELKVLSDVDDTFYCNWIDSRYPKKTVYPGVRAFYRELDLAPANGRLGDVVFLTARPGDRGGIGEGVTRKNVRERGVAHATVLTGDFAHLLTNELIAEKKVQGFVEYQRIYPEYGFVFLGDSGQGDVIAGRRMLDDASGVVRAVFIHDVVNTPAAERASHRAQRVYFHDTYVGAAVDAYEAGLIGRDAAVRVARAAVGEMLEVTFSDPTQREARILDLRRDLDRLAAHLPPGERITV